MAIMSFKSLRTSNICIDFIFGIAISDFIYSLCNVITWFDSEQAEKDAKCYAEAVIREWSLYFSLFFAIGIAVLCKKCSSLQPFDRKDQIALLIKVILIGSGICLVFTIIPFFLKKYVIYVNDNVVCHITYNNTTDPEKKLSYLEKFAVITFYEGILVTAGIIVTLKCYFHTSNFIRRVSERPRKETGYRFLVYPFVICIVFLPTVIDDYFRINHKCEYLWLMVVHMVLTHSIGFINAIAYGWQRMKQKRQRELRQNPEITGIRQQEENIVIEGRSDEESLKNNLVQALSPSPSDSFTFAARSTQP